MIEEKQWAALEEITARLGMLAVRADHSEEVSPQNIVQFYLDGVCEPFGRFESTDTVGLINCDFTGQGRIDLQGPRWKEELEGHIRFALAKTRQLRHIYQNGGWGALREADEPYNDLNRELIFALKLIHGTAFLGNVNFYGEDHELVAQGEKSVYEEYNGQQVYNFSCSFCVPTADEELESLIRAWNARDTLPKRSVEVDAITTRIQDIGGVNLIWF